MDTFDNAMQAIEELKPAMMNFAIEAVAKELISFFEKYPKVSAVKFTNDWRGNDEGINWLQFQFYVEIDGERLDSCDNYDDDTYISDVVEDIPLKLEDMVNIFGTDEVVFENEKAEYEDDDIN